MRIDEVQWARLHATAARLAEAEAEAAAAGRERRARELLTQHGGDASSITAELPQTSVGVLHEAAFVALLGDRRWASPLNVWAAG